jgi:hypothetical protein
MTGRMEASQKGFRPMRTFSVLSFAQGGAGPGPEVVVVAHDVARARELAKRELQLQNSPPTTIEVREGGRVIWKGPAAEV